MSLLLTHSLIASAHSLPPQLIELNSNPDAGERRVRATLKPLKKSRRDSDEMETQQRIKVLTDENCRSRQRLKEVAKDAVLNVLYHFFMHAINSIQQLAVCSPAVSASATRRELFAANTPSPVCC